jgi:hypothetical protein
VTTVQCSTDKGDHHRHITAPQNHSIRHHIPYTTTQTCLRPETWSVDKGQSGIGTEHRRGPVWLEMFGSPRWRRSRHPGNPPVVPGQVEPIRPVHRAVEEIDVNEIWARDNDLHRRDVSTRRDASGTPENIVNKGSNKRSDEIQGHGGLKRYCTVLTICIITSRRNSWDRLFVLYIGSVSSNTCPDRCFLCVKTLLMRSRDVRVQPC